MRLAISDPEPASADLLAFAAQRRGHQSVSVPDSNKLFARLPFEPHIVVVAVNELRGPGTAIVERVRAQFADAGIFVTVEKPREPLPAKLLNAGANEVIRVPYNPHELILRAEGWLANRGSASAVSETLKLGDLEIALDRYTATKNKQTLVLTKLELRLLYCLAEHHPHLAPLERLLTFGWDTFGDPDAALIKTHISHIRKKLRDAGGVEVEILSRQTVGYVLRLVE